MLVVVWSSERLRSATKLDCCAHSGQDLAFGSAAIPSYKKKRKKDSVLNTLAASATLVTSATTSVKTTQTDGESNNVVPSIQSSLRLS